ncbi:uncharacterized protein LOC144927765 [Branchiostoma floridae x Branchiostoma belcheri]
MRTTPYLQGAGGTNNDSPRVRPNSQTHSTSTKSEVDEEYRTQLDAGGSNGNARDLAGVLEPDPCRPALHGGPADGQQPLQRKPRLLRARRGPARRRVDVNRL